jgi:hypothetical protein
MGGRIVHVNGAFTTTPNTPLHWVILQIRLERDGMYESLDGETPRFAETGNRPNPTRMGIYPFGCPVFVEDFAPAGKESARCNMFFNLGLILNPPGVLYKHNPKHG